MNHFICFKRLFSTNKQHECVFKRLHDNNCVKIRIKQDHFASTDVDKLHLDLKEGREKKSHHF